MDKSIRSKPEQRNTVYFIKLTRQRCLSLAACKAWQLLYQFAVLARWRPIILSLPIHAFDDDVFNHAHR